jgi:hypothetical protein
MHYKNGREAKVGDQVIGRDWKGRIISGILIAIEPGSTSCNGQVIPAQQLQNAPTYTIGEMLHAEDALVPDPPKAA